MQCHVGLYLKTSITKPKTKEETIKFRSYKNYSPENFNLELMMSIEIRIGEVLMNYIYIKSGTDSEVTLIRGRKL